MLNEFIWPAEQGMMIKDQKEKRAFGPYSTSGFARLAYPSPGKNHDEQLTHIVRVSTSNLLIIKY